MGWFQSRGRKRLAAEFDAAAESVRRRPEIDGVYGKGPNGDPERLRELAVAIHREFPGMTRLVRTEDGWNARWEYRPEDITVGEFYGEDGELKTREIPKEGE